MKRKLFFVLLAGVVVLALLAAAPAAAGGNKDIPKYKGQIDISAQHIQNPVGFAVDAVGNIYLTDSYPPAPRVLKYNKHGRFVREWGSLGSEPGQFRFWPLNPEDGPNAGFLAVDSHGNVFVSDAYNYRVQKFDADGNFLMQFGKLGEGLDEFVGGPGPIYIDRQDNIYVSTFPRVQKFDPQGNFLASYGSEGTGEGQFTGAGLGAIDSQGNMYITDLFNSRIQKLDANGNFLLAWGTPGTGEGQISLPFGIALDGANRLYIADNTTRIQIFTTDGQFLGQINEAGKGAALGYTSVPVLDRKDNLFVADVLDFGVGVHLYVYNTHP
jgi:tripartite motif-containing protein 71